MNLSNHTSFQIEKITPLENYYKTKLNLDYNRSTPQKTENFHIDKEKKFNNFCVNELNFTYEPDPSYVESLAQKENDILNRIQEIDNNNMLIESELMQEQEKLDLNMKKVENCNNEYTLVNNMIGALHQYIEQLRGFMRVWCFIKKGENTILKINNEFSFTIDEAEFNFDKIYVDSSTLMNEILKQFEESENYSLITFGNLDSNFLLEPLIERLLKRLNTKKATGISISCFEITSEQIQQGAQISLENLRILYDSFKGEIVNTQVVQIKYEKDLKSYFVNIILNSKAVTKQLVNVMKVLSLLSNKKTNKSQVPFNSSKLTMFLKSFFKPNDKVNFLMVLNECCQDKEIIQEYLSNLLNNNLIF